MQCGVQHGLCTKVAHGLLRGQGEADKQQANNDMRAQSCEEKGPWQDTKEGQLNSARNQPALPSGDEPERGLGLTKGNRQRGMTEGRGMEGTSRAFGGHAGATA